ncbi:hypothetical protein DRH29_01385 [candidate division Kazan bacterium]|uniref:DUF11 domain-containing protein n=1 Tax=candidate division Kazan bacterium TaxID=2202143 RepID=A0A420ZDN5_UNCK3|nr:MAG: hypothetical protein DRH29_01385 [candidate division Kazan bacterium]
MSTVLLQKSTRAIAWLIAASVAIAFAAPQALAFENLGTFRYQWKSQSGTISADGTAHEVAVNPGDTVSMSLTITNRSTNPRALVMYGTSALLDEGASYPYAHAVGLGTSHPRDNVPAWIDSSSFAINGNRFTYYDGEPVNPGEDMTLTFDVKISSTAANGTYDLYTEIVREWDGWAQQVTAAGVPIGNGDIFWRFLIGGTVTGGGDLNVGIAGDTPASDDVANGAVDVVMAKINFTAGASDNALVSSLAIRRTGLSADDDVSDIKLYDGTTKIGSTQGLNTTTHKATFTGLSWLIPAGTTKTLTIKGSIPSATADTGKIITLGIQSASDVVLSGGGTVAGNFPAYGNEFTVGGISVGQLDVDVQTSPAAANILSGSTDQAIASWKFTANSTEGFDINSITFTEIGTSVDSDLSNMVLKINGVQIGTSVASLANGKVTFTGSPLFSVAAGNSEYLYIYADIADGVTSERTVRFEINAATDIVAYGQNSNGIVTVTYSSNTTFVAQQGKVMTIVQGTLTVAKHATNLAAQTYIVGEEQVEIGKWKFSAGSREGLKITKLIFNEDSTATSTDYQNAKLYIDESETPISAGGSISSTTITFEDGNGLFEVPKSGNTVVTLKFDISSSAVAGDDFRVGIGTDSSSYTNITMYGLTSGDKIDQDSSHITLTSCSDGDMNTHTVAAYGTLVVSNGPNTPAAANYALGTDDYEFLQFRMQASSEAMRVTALTVRFYDDASSSDAYASGDEIATGDVTNVALYYWDGSAWIMLGSEVSSPTTGVASFTFDHTIPKNTTETYKVVGDIPTTSAASYIYADVGATTGATTGVTTAADITTTGVSSAASIDETGSADGNLMTKVTPIITVNASTVPAARTVIKNGNDILLGKFFLTANDVEDIKISTLKIYADDTDAMNSTSGVDGDISTVYLRFDDGGTWRTTKTENWVSDTPDYITYTGSDFNDPNEWVVPKGGSLVVEIRGDITDTGTAYVGMTTASTNVVGSGLSSGTSATIYDYQNNAYNQVWASPKLTLAASGTLTVTAATDTPSVQMVTATYDTDNRTTPTFFRIKLAGANEAIEVDALRAKVADAGDASEDDNFSGTVYVYEGGTMSDNVLTGGTLVGSGTLIPVSSADAAADIIFDTVVTVPENGNAYLTLLAELNSMTEGADSMDVPYLGLDYNVQTGIWDANYADDYNIRATGTQSNSKIYSAGTITSILKGEAAVVAKTALGMAKHSNSPSGTATRHANHTIFKLAMTNTNPDQDALFRAGAAQYTATTASAGVGTWTACTVGDTVANDSTNYITGSGAVKVTLDTPAAVGDGMYWKADAATDLSDYERVSVWVRSSVAIATAGDLEFEVDDTDALASPELNSDLPVLNANTWYRHDAALGDAIEDDAQYWGVRVAANHTTYNSAVITLDNIVFYRDALTVNLSSNGGLFNTTGATNTAITLKDGTTTLATGYYSGTGTAKLSTSNGEVTFIPTTERTIPASGKTWDIVADTSTLVTNTSKDLTMLIDLGSASSAGAITEGDVLWNDNSYTLNIGWVDNRDTSTLSAGLNF